MLVWMSKGSAVMGAATYHARIVCGLGMLFEFRPTRFRDAVVRAFWAGHGPMPGREIGCALGDRNGPDTGWTSGHMAASDRLARRRHSAVRAIPR